MIFSVLGKKPLFTAGMSRLVSSIASKICCSFKPNPQLRDETWAVRNRVKRHAVTVVAAHYGLNPPEETYMGGVMNAGPKQKARQKEAFIRQKVDELLADGSKYLYGTTNSGVTIRIHYTSFVIDVYLGVYAICQSSDCRSHRVLNI